MPSERGPSFNFERSPEKKPELARISSELNQDIPIIKIGENFNPFYLPKLKNRGVTLNNALGYTSEFLLDTDGQLPALRLQISTSGINFDRAKTITPSDLSVGYQITDEDYNYETRIAKLQKYAGEIIDPAKGYVYLDLSSHPNDLEKQGFVNSRKRPGERFSAAAAKVLNKLRLQIHSSQFIDLESRPDSVSFALGELSLRHFYPILTGPLATHPEGRFNTNEGLTLALPGDLETLRRFSMRLILRDRENYVESDRRQSLLTFVGFKKEIKEPSNSNNQSIEPKNLLSTPEKVKSEFPSTAVSKFKESDIRKLSNDELEEFVTTFFRDKGYPSGLTSFLTNEKALGEMITEFVYRQYESAQANRIDAIFKKAGVNFRDRSYTYSGAPEQTAGIDQAIVKSSYKEDDRRIFSAFGATRLFENPGLLTGVEDLAINTTPIIVLGGGPGGLITTRALVELGFDSKYITVIDKSGKYGGIWNQKNVAGASKNNPFPITSMGVEVGAAPGYGSDITRFLEEMVGTEDFDADGFFLDKLPDPVKGSVVGVKPGDLNHVVRYKDETGKIKSVRAPIVINALGVGKPMPLNDEKRMTTDSTDGGIRWQQVLTKEQGEKLNGKTVILIGLGNSTAEMMVQINDLNRKHGLNIDYRVITHYPKEAVMNPQSEVEVDGKKYKVARTTKDPVHLNLTKLAYDLTDIETAYNIAILRDKIIPGVVHWKTDEIKGRKYFVHLDKNENLGYVPYEQLYTLTGYRQEPELLKAMGMVVTDEHNGTIAYDFDGEIQKKVGAQGRERVHAGYYAIGALLKNQLNPNAQVIPGIQHRLYDMLFSIIMRSTEWEHFRSH